MATKTYRHRVPGAKFFMPDGREICFIAGKFSTEDALIQLELDKIANVPASQIYTTAEPVKAMEERAVVAEIQTAATRSFDAENKITGPAETVEIPVNPDPRPTLQSSGIAGATAVERAKQQLAERQAQAKK